MHTREDSVEIVKDPCHFPDPADIKKRKLRKTLKGRAVVWDVRPRKFNIAAWCGVNEKITVHLSIYSVKSKL